MGGSLSILAIPVAAVVIVATIFLVQIATAGKRPNPDDFAWVPIAYGGLVVLLGVCALVSMLSLPR